MPGLIGNRGTNGAPEKLDCALCMDKAIKDDTTTAILTCSSSCVYHEECLKAVFHHAAASELYFPARCNCKIVIDLTRAVELLLGDDLTQEYNDKQWEYLGPGRLYCWGNDCWAFIPPSARLDGYGQCVADDCGKKTCVICGKAMHNDDCVEEPSEKAFTELCEREGWQGCRHCGRMVEHMQGCNDIE
ncbi:hypothetical protein F5X99DRAFT_393991 [Biscogniauxia marginata]|nr:hypothetical protein F5X99DRAFT_393991 [Biscogniauxia marginata]